MKKLIKNFTVLSFLAVIFSCGGGGGDTGQLIGSLDRPTWKGINPFGMVYIPSGTLHIGPGDQDVSNTFVQRSKSISINGFYMDDTEITNNEWRQYVEFVRDSIAHTYLDNFYESEDGEQYIDYGYEIDWSDETLDDLFHQGDDKFNSGNEINASKLLFEYSNFDWKRAASDNSDWQRVQKEGGTSRGDYINTEEVIIYPDTLCWIRDFSYSYNEPLTRNYFWHPAYDDYPVVGINWKMANAFNHWRTQIWDSYQSIRKDGINSEDFRLPTEHEWEYAARGGHESAPYPWGGYYLRNAKGCLLANFKPGRGNYPEDGGLYTVKADAYFPNDFGLYNMAGNVSEWTSTAFHENAYSFLHDLNPDLRYDAKEEESEFSKRKVIRGGSWKDVGFFLQTGTRHWEFQDTTKSYVGFRSALTFLGRSLNDF